MRIPYVILSLVLAMACGNPEPPTGVPAHYTRVSDPDLLALARDFALPDAGTLILLGAAGDTLTMDSLVRIEEPDRFVLHYYRPPDGPIDRAVLADATASDRQLRKQLTRAMNEGPELRPVPVDCGDQVRLLQEVFERDQAIRTTLPYDRRVDHENLEIIVSFLEKCGMPRGQEVDDVQMAAIWAVLQHGPLRYREHYLPLLRQSAESGDLSWGVVAMMTDRNLLDNGLPQRYGTQYAVDPVTGQQSLAPLADPDSLTVWRAAMGLPPLEAY